MPCSVLNLLSIAGVAYNGSVSWGDSIPERGSGIYVVSLSKDPAEIPTLNRSAPLSLSAIQELLDVRPELTLVVIGRRRRG